MMPEQSKTPSWEEYETHPKYKELSLEKRQKLGNNYFDKHVATSKAYNSRPVETQNKYRESWMTRVKPPETNVLGAVGDVARGLTRVPVDVLAAGASMIDDPYTSSGVLDPFIEWNKKKQAAFANRPGAEEIAVPGTTVTRKEIRQGTSSLGHSAVAMGAALVPRVAAAGASALAGSSVPLAGTITGAIIGWGAGAAASGKAAYNMDKNAFVREYRGFLEQKEGRKISDDEFAQYKSGEVADLLHEHGLHEAGWEGLGNMLELGILGKIKGGNIGKKALKGLTGLIAFELGSETQTAIGQKNVEVDLGMAPESERRSYLSLKDQAKSAREVAPATFLMGGITTAGKYGYEKAFNTKEQLDTVEDPGPLTRAGQGSAAQAMGDAAAVLGTEEGAARDLADEIQGGMATKGRLLAIQEQFNQDPELLRNLQTTTDEDIDIEGLVTEGISSYKETSLEEQTSVDGVIDILTDVDTTKPEGKQALVNGLMRTLEDPELSDVAKRRVVNSGLMEEAGLDPAEYSGSPTDSAAAQAMGAKPKEPVGQTVSDAGQERTESPIKQAKTDVKEPETTVEQVVEERTKPLGNILKEIRDNDTFEPADVPAIQKRIEESATQQGIETIRADLKTAVGTPGDRAGTYGALINQALDRKEETLETTTKGNQKGEEVGAAKVTGETTKETITTKSSVAEGQEVETAPTEKQKEAGNYSKAHVKLDGLDVTVENPAGSTRSGKDDGGREWSQKMVNDYGYIKETTGFDKDHVDVFYDKGYKGGAEKVHIVNQYRPDGSFDEHKVVIGAGSRRAALGTYKANYEKGWKGGKLSGTVEMSMADFKVWVKSDAPKKGPAGLGAEVDFKDAVKSIVKDKKTASAVNSVIDARAKSMGMTTRDYLDSRGIVLMADSDIGSSKLRQENKGAVDLSEEGEAIIHAFENADASTILHELGHIFRQDLTGKDLTTVEKWAGVKDGKWNRAAEEKFARGWENYLATGKAPVAGLQRAFDSIKKAMLDVYGAITGTDIDVKVSPAVKAVFDNLLTPTNPQKVIQDEMTQKERFSKQEKNGHTAAKIAYDSGLPYNEARQEKNYPNGMPTDKQLAQAKVKNLGLEKLSPYLAGGLRYDPTTKEVTFDPQDAIFFQGISSPVPDGERGAGRWLRGDIPGKDNVKAFMDKITKNTIDPNSDGNLATLETILERGENVTWVDPVVIHSRQETRWDKDEDTGAYGNEKLKFSNWAYPQGRNTWDIQGCGRAHWANSNGLDAAACYGGKCYAEAIKIGKQGKLAGVTGGINKLGVSKGKKKTEMLNYFKENGIEMVREKYGKDYEILVHKADATAKKGLGENPAVFEGEAPVEKKPLMKATFKATGDTKLTKALRVEINTSLKNKGIKPTEKKYKDFDFTVKKAPLKMRVENEDTGNYPPGTFTGADIVGKKPILKVTFGYFKRADGKIIPADEVVEAQPIAAVVSTNLQDAKGVDIRLGVDTDGSAWLSDPTVMDAIIKGNPRTLSLYSSAYHKPPPPHALSDRTIINVTVSGWHPLAETISRIRWAEQARANGWNVILREVVANPDTFDNTTANHYNRVHDAVMNTDFFVMQQPLHAGSTMSDVPMWGMPACCKGSHTEDACHTCDQCEVAEGLGKGFQQYWNIHEEQDTDGEVVLPGTEYIGRQLGEIIWPDGIMPTLKEEREGTDYTTRDPETAGLLFQGIVDEDFQPWSQAANIEVEEQGDNDWRIIDSETSESIERFSNEKDADKRIIEIQRSIEDLKPTIGTLTANTLREQFGEYLDSEVDSELIEIGNGRLTGDFYAVEDALEQGDDYQTVEEYAQEERDSYEIGDEVEPYESDVTEPVPSEYEDRAIAMFGLTEYPELAGYMLANGDMLDFSEGQGDRGLDHRAVERIVREPSTPEANRHGAIEEFGSETRAIRMDISAETAMFDIQAPPTMDQIAKMHEIAEGRDIDIDYIDENGRQKNINADEYEAYEAIERATDSADFVKVLYQSEPGNPASNASLSHGEKLLKDIISQLEGANIPVVTVKMGTARIKKTLDALHENMVMMSDSQTSIIQKQKFAADFVKALPPIPRAKLLHPLAAISKPKTQKAQMKRLEFFLERSNKVLGDYLRQELVKSISDSVKPKAIKAGAILTGKGADFERNVKYINAVINGMRSEAKAGAEYAILEAEQTKWENELANASSDTERATYQHELDIVEVKFGFLDMFGEINRKSVEQLGLANQALKTFLKEGRLQWLENQKEWKDIIAKDQNMTSEGIAKDGDVTIETQSEKVARENKERDSKKVKTREGYNAILNTIQSFELALDRIAGNKKFGMLKSKIVETFGSVIHEATNAYKKFQMDTDDLLMVKAAEIWGKKDKALNKEFDKLGIVEENKIHLYKDGKATAIEMSPMQAAYWYQVWVGRIGNKAIKDTFEEMGVTTRTMGEIENMMTPELKAWADYLVREFYQDFHTGVNDIYKMVKGIDLEKTPLYTPLRREVEGLTRDKEKEGMTAMTSKNTNKGGFHTRVYNKKPFKTASINEVLFSHTADMNHFKAWAVPTKRLNGTFDNPMVRNLIERHHGKEAMKAISFFQKQFTMTLEETLKDNIRLIDRLRSNVTVAMVGMNPVVFVKQLTSIPALAADIPSVYWSKVSALTMTPGGYLKALKTLNTSTMMKDRYKSGHERDVKYVKQRSAGERLSGAKSGLRDLSDKAMKLTAWGDQAAIVVGGYPVYKYHYAQAKKAGKSKSEAHKIGIQKFEMAVSRSQQSADMKDMGTWQSGDSMKKLFTMFMTSPASYSRLIDAGVRNLKTDKVNAGKMLFIYGVVMPMVFQAVSDGFLAHDEDDDERIKELAMHQASAVARAPFNGVPIARTLAESAFSKMTGTGWRGIQYSPITEAPKELLSIIENLEKGLTGGSDRIDSDEYYRRSFFNVLHTLGYYFGMPTKPASRVIGGVLDATETDLPWRDATETERKFRRGIGFSRTALGEK